MAKQLLLVDLENVHDVDLATLDENWRVIIFVDVSQKTVPITLVTAAQRLGSRVEWQRLEASGRNALDFFIADQFGRDLTTRLECTILSKDKGFDPLIRHLCDQGFRCQRIDSLTRLDPDEATKALANGPTKTKAKAKPKGVAPPMPSLPEQCARVVELLKKLEKIGRPRRRKTLSQFIAGVFNKKIDKPGIQLVIEQLMAEKLITITSDVIGYEF